MRWGESQNLKLVRAFLIGFPSVFVFGFFFGTLDKLAQAQGGGLPPGLPFLASFLLVAVTWLPPVPRPEVLRVPWREGPAGAWRWRSLRALFIFLLVLVVFGGFWEAANAITIATLNEGSEDFWAARTLFAGLYGFASILFTVGPEEALVGDLRPWGREERSAATRLGVSLLVGWLVFAVPAIGTALVYFPTTDLLAIAAGSAFFGLFLGLLLFVNWGLIRDARLRLRQPTR